MTELSILKLMLCFLAIFGVVPICIGISLMTIREWIEFSDGRKKKKINRKFNEVIKSINE